MIFSSPSPRLSRHAYPVALEPGQDRGHGSPVTLVEFPASDATHLNRIVRMVRGSQKGVCDEVAANRSAHRH